MNPHQVKSIVFAMADGATILWPVAAPFVKAIEAIIDRAEAMGIEPYAMSAEQAAAVAAGMAAHDASLLTSERAKKG